MTVVFRRWPLNVRSPEFQSSARAALRLQQIDAVAVTGDSIRPFGRVSASAFCCAEAIGLLSPLSSRTGAVMLGNSGETSTLSKQSCIAAATSGGVRSISRTTQSHKASLAWARSSRLPRVCPHHAPTLEARIASDAEA